MPLVPGIYEQIINSEVKKLLNSLKDELVYSRSIDPAEASKILSLYVSSLLHEALEYISDKSRKEDKINKQISFVNSVISNINRELQTSRDPSEFIDLLLDKEIDPAGQELLSIIDEHDPRLLDKNFKVKNINRPDTSILESTLFTGYESGIKLYCELKKEIETADSIDLMVSFIRFSGLRLILDDLERFTRSGHNLRIVTTTYTGATEFKAIEKLSELPNTEIKISYETTQTRHHAKAYIFNRNNGFSTAYIGSSNLSSSAIGSGLEWNLKITEQELPDIIKKVRASFQTYLEDKSFVKYTNTDEDRKRLREGLKQAKKEKIEGQFSFFFDINPYWYQQEILDKLQAERELHHRYKNLVVAATGTGKTLISAFDFKRFAHSHPGRKANLLFVAHREEILKQSLSAFRAVLKDPNFGSLFVGNYRPEDFEHLFVSIQTANSRKLHQILAKDFYDYIIVDEFHHAAAQSYQDLLNYFEPKILLGLTATPERMDGLSILPYFDNRIAAEIRLPEAIERNLLCPFQYFGISDSTDLDKIKWSKGGYDVKELENVYTLEELGALQRVDCILNNLDKYINSLDEVHGLGFCCSIKHAEFMSQKFNEAHIPAKYLTAKSSAEDRTKVQCELESGQIKFIFVVDLYNEGVDIPCINTVLFLRPTESLTVFLQQLGRGLRLYNKKECLTVLDFVGNSNKKYRFDDKFSALLYDPARNTLEKEIKNNFPHVPNGCFIYLERKVQKVILESIKQYSSSEEQLIVLIKEFCELNKAQNISLQDFLKYSSKTLTDLYKKDYSFKRLCAKAGVIPDFNEPLEVDFRKSFKKFCQIDSYNWLVFLIEMLQDVESLDLSKLSIHDMTLFDMFYITLYGKSLEISDSHEVESNLQKLKQSKNLVAEAVEILSIKLDDIDLVSPVIDLGYDCPLDVHCTYSRDQLFVALGFKNPSTIREGVKYLKEIKTDVLLVTLNKSDKEYSPSTMYDDYSINESQFCWQTQSTISDHTATAQRYFNGEGNILLFVRDTKKNSLGSVPYTFLGPVHHLSHTGNRPVSIIWKLDYQILPRYLKKTNKLLVG